MNLFRSLLFWIILALAGALVAQLLAQDPGEVIVNFSDWSYRKSLSYTLLLLIVGVMVVWVAWRVLSAPFVILRRRRKKAARVRLIDGLEAVHQGHWSRGEKLLDDAARDREVATVARIGAAHAASGRGDLQASRKHLAPLLEQHAAAHAV
ncbi:heme biosynthesis HemY N-terminal domain-containing protein, partial [Marilutibacter aestuarii]